MAQPSGKTRNVLPHPKPEFTGVIEPSAKDSRLTKPKITYPPEGAPNVVIVLFDDTGLAAWSPFGGGINMPTLQKLSDQGLLYSQWHTTALC